MTISILTLFPDMFRGVFDYSIIKRTQQKNLVTISFVNIRNFATDAHKTVDDRPYGGGTGMILRVDVVDRALDHVKQPTIDNRQQRIVLLDPQGTPYTQSKAKELSRLNHLILLCGHYEGVDDRIRSLVDEELSIGDYILTGGEIPAMAIVDSVVRLISGVLVKPTATESESFAGDVPRLEYPQYTRPEIYKRKRVPTILLSGNHKAIAAWRHNQAIKRTKKRRPDLI